MTSFFVCLSKGLKELKFNLKEKKNHFHFKTSENLDFTWTSHSELL